MHSHSWRTRLLLLGVALTLAVHPARAQTAETGLIEGRVRTPDGQGVSAAEVAIALGDGSYARKVSTSATGSFRVNFLKPGSYTVTVRAIGFRPVSLSRVDVRAANRTPVDVTLQAAAVQLQELVAVEDAVVIDKSTAEFSNALEAAEREKLPAPRDVNALLQFTPGVRNGQVYGGSTNQANLYTFDGVAVNAPGRGGSFLLPNPDWIESIEVKGLGAGAEYGNFQGGLINIVTKSGTNTTQGQFKSYYDNASLNGTNLNVEEDGAEIANRSEFTGEVRGPIVKDKLFYYVSGQEIWTNTRVLDATAAPSTSGDPVFLGTRANRRDRKYYGKLTWQASPRDILNGSFGVDVLNRERIGLSGFDAIDATYQGRQRSFFYNANWQRSFSEKAFLEAKFSGYNGRVNELPYNGSDRSAVRILGAPGQFVNAFYTRRDRPSSLAGTLNFDAFVNTGSVEHHLKIGADATFGSWREQRSRNGGLTWYGVPDDATGAPAFNPTNPATWGDLGFGDNTYATTDWGGDIDLNARTLNSAIFAQDYIRVSPKLALSPGVRLGYWRGNITPGNGSTADPFTALSSTAIDPRLGVTYDVTGEGDLVFKGHYGQYRQNLFAFLFDRAPGSSVFTDIEFFDWNDKTKATLPDLNRRYTLAERAALFTGAGGASLFAEADSIGAYRQPFVEQVTLGVEKKLGRHLKGELIYVGRTNRNILALEDRNLASNWTALQNVTVGGERDANGNPLVLPTVWVRNDDLRRRLAAGNTIPGFTRADTARISYAPEFLLQTQDDSRARRRFDQVQAVFSGAYPTWDFNLAFAYTRLVGNLFTVNGYASANGQGNGPFVNPNEQTNFYGNLPGASPVEVKLRVSGRLKYGFEGGLFALVQTGDRFNSVYRIDRGNALSIGTTTLPSRLFTSVDGQGILLEERGSRRYNTLAQLDLRLAKTIELAGSSLLLGLDVFNVLNSGTVIAVRQTVNDVTLDGSGQPIPATQFGAPQLRIAPRTIRLNTQVRF